MTQCTFIPEQEMYKHHILCYD